ncbi:MAG: hypothetical protein CVV11_19775 [Gammaproteobacteria bacterium HGW-Gammaproteobacteria-15]|nr:MAG: hypothetical protein CVV11_19775 [Gammaproteobacteria bacterium HGW-Gammaproteobacteria-15]
MSYYLNVPHIVGRAVDVNIPIPTAVGGVYNFEFEFELKALSTEFTVSGLNISASNDIFFLKASVMEYRRTGNTNINMTHGVTIADWHKYRFVFTGSGVGNIAFYVDGVFKANYTPSASLVTTNLLTLFQLSSSVRTAHFRYYKFTDFNNVAANRMFDARAHVPGDTVLRDTANGANGTFTAAWVTAGVTFVPDAPPVTPIAFTGSIPAQTFTAGDAVDVNLAGYFSGTQTPFTFANTGTSLSGTGLSITSAGRLQGTATAASVSGVIVTGTDASSNTASSNAFNVTVNAIPALPPQGSVTMGTITVGETTASVPFSYSASDQTGFMYRLNGGSPITVTANPISLTGLTASTGYTIDVAAVNANGTGTYSSTAGFTTTAAPSTDPVFTSAQPLRDNTAQLLNNTLLDYVRLYSVTTGELVAEFLDVTTNSSGYFSVTSALLMADTAYKADWQVNATGVGRMPQATAV